MKPWERFAVLTLIGHYDAHLELKDGHVSLTAECSVAITPGYVKQLEETLDDTFQERASVKEFDGNMTKEQAEAQAFEELKQEIVKI